MIEIKNLNFYYDGRQVLHDINIDFKHHPIHLVPKPKGPPLLRSVGPLLKVRGVLISSPKQKPATAETPTTQEAKVYTLIGPSGSGKSTLLRTLNRMDALYANQKASGEILIDGQNILAKNVDIEMLRAKVGMVFQKPTPFALSIFDNIAFALKLHRKLTRAELHEEVEHLLTAVGLFNEVKNNLKRSAFALSGGQQQRLCFARTLATNPKILLLDEPTSSLDPTSTARIEELINTLKKDYLIIMVTHNLAQAKRMGDYTLFMKEGRIIEMNETEYFFTEPQKPETQKYIEFT